MGSADPGEAVTVQPTSETKRKVSIQSDPVAESRIGYDNLGYDLHPRRKISQVEYNNKTAVAPVNQIIPI